MMRFVLQQRFEIEFLETIFPRVEELLGTTEYQKALAHVSSRKTATLKRYRSKMDFLFCEVFLEYQKPCREFYDGEGEALGFLLEGAERELLEDKLLEALEHAYRAFRRKRRLSWVQFRLFALAAAA